MKQEATSVMIELRPAVQSDVEMVFKWRNSRFIVDRGSSHRAVTWEEHKKWFESLEGNAERVMYIIQKGNIAMGQVRFDRVDRQSCVITVYLLEEFTGKGHGIQAIRAGCDNIFRLWGIDRIIAEVLIENAPARKAFIKAGFVEDRIQPVGNEQHVRFVNARLGK